MKIGIDGSILSMHPCGMSMYVLELLSNLPKKIDKCYVVLPNKNLILRDIHIQNVKYICFPNLPFIRYGTFWRKKLLPFLLQKLRVDIFHFPVNLIPMRVNRGTSFFKLVVNIHDIIPLVLKDYFLDHIQDYLQEIGHTVNNADHIITGSECSKNDIINILKIPKEKITVIYNGIEKRFKPNRDLSRIKEIKYKYNLPDEFLLNVGGDEERKNLQTLIKAYLLFLKMEPKSKANLVIITKGRKRTKRLKILVKNLNLEGRVYFLPFVPDHVLPLVYNCASAFVFPSLYEGFGFPPLEAMACGCPVITSNTSSLPEVVGDAGLLVNPYDVNEIADTILTVLSNEHLRNDLIKKGLNRVKEFSWEKAAQQTLKVYKEVHNE